MFPPKYGYQQTFNQSHGCIWLPLKGFFLSLSFNRTIPHAYKSRLRTSIQPASGVLWLHLPAGKSALSPENQFEDYCQSVFLFSVYPPECLGVKHRQRNTILRFNFSHQIHTVYMSITARGWRALIKLPKEIRAQILESSHISIVS